MEPESNGSAFALDAQASPHQVGAHVGDRADDRAGDEADERAEPGRAEFWATILQASDDIDKMTASVVSVPPVAGVQPDREEGPLAALHNQVRDRLDQMRHTLRAVPDSDRIVLILVLFFDERIMHQLSEARRLHWPLLQWEWLGSSNGGDEFYRILERLLEDERTSPFVIETFYWCLINGFVGRYAGQPDAIEAYKRQLRLRITLSPVPDGGASDDAETGAISTPRPVRPIWYYLGTAVAMVAVAVLSTALSNCS